MAAMKSALLIGMMLALAACAARPAPPAAEDPAPFRGRIGLMSDAFIDGRPIPSRFARDGANLSPPLVWTSLPVQTQELAIIASSLDAPPGAAIHWVVYNIPATYRYLQGGLPRQQELPSGIRQGRNDFKRVGYDGPQPPPGPPQRYIFRLYALDRQLDLKPGVTGDVLLRAMQGHVLDAGEIVGTYQR
jgi:Raf kinase inhibitor-like YbhB/YbcL family protein